MEMPDVLNIVGPTVRWLHLGACVGLVGIAAFLLLAGRSDLAAARAWHSLMLRWSRALALTAIAGGILTLAHQTMILEGRSEAALDPAALGRVLFETQVGLVWLARHALLLLLAAFLLARLDLSRPADWIATRCQLLLLGALVLGLLAASGHSAAAEPDAARAIGLDVVHLIAAGIWAGGLPALAALLRSASLDGADEARNYAARAGRRFSHTALASVLLLVATGIANTLYHVGSIPALLGTPYGQLLLLKLVLLGIILALAVRARCYLFQGALAKLRRVAVAEAGLVVTMLLVVAVMGLTKPARHEQPTWPLAFRFVSSAEAASAIALPTAVLRAHPTTYMRPAVPYTAPSIVSGAAIYQEHCTACHRAEDMRSAAVRSHTAGDLFWWLSHGKGAWMPGFADRLSAEQRWDLVNYIRTLEAAELAKQIAPSADAAQPRPVAPDFNFAVGPTAQALRDFRGERMVLLVLYSLPGSRERIRQLALAIDALYLAGVEIIALPSDAAPDAIRQLGAERGLYFSVVTDGARDVVQAYNLLSGGAPHAEFLIDRQGYIRARWTAGAGETRRLDHLLATVQQLRAEQPALPAEEHVH